jgi:hypothetical protein
MLKPPNEALSLVHLTVLYFNCNKCRGFFFMANAKSDLLSLALPPQYFYIL